MQVLYWQLISKIYKPTNAALFKIPFSVNVNGSSHSISIKGTTNPIFRVSTIVAIRHNPHVINNNAWNLPSPKINHEIKKRVKLVA
jgi:hypothetical protein